jgi:hypothetical protein
MRVQPKGGPDRWRRVSATEVRSPSPFETGYERRPPEESLLYQVVQAHWPSFEAELDREGEGRSLSAFIRQEFAAYLRCGILAHGFVRARCSDCEDSRLVAFSCKRRGFCPSCIGRRMNETAAHLRAPGPPDLRCVRARRNGLCVDLSIAEANGYAERDEALDNVRRLRRRGYNPKSVAGDKGYCLGDFPQRLVDLKLRPHLAIPDNAPADSPARQFRRSAGYRISQVIRKRVEEIFGWAKTVGGFRKTRYKGRQRTWRSGYFVAAAPLPTTTQRYIDHLTSSRLRLAVPSRLVPSQAG